MKQAAKLIHHAKYRYNINKNLHQEMDFFRKMLQSLLGITWETPIAHIIPRIPTATTFADSCLEGAGGYLISLGYWWHLPFPKEVIHQTLIHKKDIKDGLLILMNSLEFVTVIIYYCASLHVFMMKNIINDPHPVLLNVTDNGSALSWTNHTCRKSKLGRLLAQCGSSVHSKSTHLWGLIPSGSVLMITALLTIYLKQKRHCLTHFILLTIPLCARHTRS
jgi:hypothetical protein